MSILSKTEKKPLVKIEIPDIDEMESITLDDAAAEIDEKKREKLNHNESTEINDKDTSAIEYMKKWKKEVLEIREKLSLENLIFKNETSAEIDIISNSVSATFKTVDYKTVVDIADEMYIDSSNHSPFYFENYTQLMNLSEAIVDIKFGSSIVNFNNKTRMEKFNTLKNIEYNVLHKIIDKYQKFKSACMLLISDEGEGKSLADKLKK